MEHLEQYCCYCVVPLLSVMKDHVKSYFKTLSLSKNWTIAHWAGENDKLLSQMGNLCPDTFFEPCIYILENLMTTLPDRESANKP